MKVFAGHEAGLHPPGLAMWHASVNMGRSFRDHSKICQIPIPIRDLRSPCGAGGGGHLSARFSEGPQ